MGCITFSNVNFINTEILIDNIGCKNSVHIINSFGNLKKMKGKNLSNDAFDIDYSNLKIANAEINQSGSECLSLKTGKYYIKKIIASQCIHGISIGENGYLEIDNLQLEKADTAITIKDNSMLLLKKQMISNVNYCLKIFKKNPQFNSSKVSWGNINGCLSKKASISSDENAIISKIF
jgi:hypothetical protein